MILGTDDTRNCGILSGSSKPRTVKTLSGTINAIFQKTLSEEEILVLLRELQQAKIIAIDDTKIIYL